MNTTTPHLGELSRKELLARSADWAGRLLNGPISFFPIRHHSPACAWHLQQWIHDVRPESIIVEGPRSFDRWIPCLTEEGCRPPVALLSTWVESDAADAVRHSAFYPLCEYSPEWVAIRCGTGIGARVRFADLEFADKVLARTANGQTMPGMPELLVDESHLRFSTFIRELVRRMGCRDFDELWDHLFESNVTQQSTEQLVGTLATYCDLSRGTWSDTELTSDATLNRETEMRKVIRSEFRRLKQPQRRGTILVVTGGFHTVALHDTVRSDSKKRSAKSGESPAGRSESWLIRYSFDQLDALAGYQSGMPSPGFYDHMWQALNETSTSGRARAAALLSRIARETRDKPISHEASVTDSIAALNMMDRLADLRGHHTPTRTDLLDAITSCMQKDSTADHSLPALALTVLAGDSIGRVPPSAGRPPILDDFERCCRQSRLPIDTIEHRNLTLELYRQPAHRPISFLLHQLQLLDVPYGMFLDGPDFIQGWKLGKLTETWRVAWSPAVEGRLSELAALGDSIAAATEGRIMQLLQDLDTADQARSASMAIELLVRTCRAGLHRLATRIVQVAEFHIAEDAVFASVTTALSQLELLKSARQPLEASRLAQLEALTTQCYRRICHLADGLGTIPDEELNGSLDGLLSVRELLAAQSEEPTDSLDAELFWQSLQRLLNSDVIPRSEIAGAAAGLLFGAGRFDESAVCNVVRQYLAMSTDDVSSACGVVRGLMTTSREAFWRMNSLLREIDELFRHWEDDRFNNALPHLRLAFSQLSPKEVDAVAAEVATLHDVDELGSLINPDVTEEEVHLGLAMAELMNRSLKDDGLLRTEG